MHSGEPDQFDVKHFEPRQMDRNVGPEPDTLAERIASRSARSRRLGGGGARSDWSRCRIVDREYPPLSRVLRASTAKAGAGPRDGLLRIFTHRLHQAGPARRSPDAGLGQGCEPRVINDGDD
jgi:hypothetical protein